MTTNANNEIGSAEYHFRSHGGAGGRFHSRGGIVGIVADQSETLGKRVARLRKARNLSQYGLAKAANVSIGYVQKLEKDNIGSPSIEHLSRIGAVLGYSIDQLISQDEDIQKRAQQVIADRESIPALVRRIAAQLQAEDPTFKVTPRTLQLVEQVVLLLPVLDTNQQESVASIIRGLATAQMNEQPGPKAPDGGNGNANDNGRAS